MIEALAVDHDIRVVLCATMPLEPDVLAATRAFCSDRGIGLTYWPTGGFTHDRRWMRRIRAGFGSLLGLTDRLIRRPLPEAISSMITDADLLWVVRPDVFADHGLPDHRAMVLDVDDLFEDVHLSPSLGERAWMRRHLRLRSTVASSAKFALVCSQQDLELANLPCEVRVLPNTAPAPHTTPDALKEGADAAKAEGPRLVEPVVLLVGTMGYGPNYEGALWMGEQVWPLVTAAQPDAILRVVGQNSERLEALGGIGGVEIVGAVDDMAPYLDEAMVSVAPIHRGSGTRVKVLEAFAAGVPVVATTIGAYGIDVRVGTDLHVTDDPVEFAAAIVALLNDRAARTAMGHAGRAVYERSHSASVFTEHVRAIARDAIADRS
jgi:hypothetical protein